jgi:hypothetical protein
MAGGSGGGPKLWPWGSEWGCGDRPGTNVYGGNGSFGRRRGGRDDGFDGFGGFMDAAFSRRFDQLHPGLAGRVALGQAVTEQRDDLAAGPVALLADRTFPDTAHVVTGTSGRAFNGVLRLVGQAFQPDISTTVDWQVGLSSLTLAPLSGWKA